MGSCRRSAEQLQQRSVLRTPRSACRALHETDQGRSRRRARARAREAPAPCRAIRVVLPLSLPRRSAGERGGPETVEGQWLVNARSARAGARALGCDIRTTRRGGSQAGRPLRVVSCWWLGREGARERPVRPQRARAAQHARAPRAAAAVFELHLQRSARDDAGLFALLDDRHAMRRPPSSAPRARPIGAGGVVRASGHSWDRAKWSRAMVRASRTESSCGVGWYSSPIARCT